MLECARSKRFRFGECELDLVRYCLEHRGSQQKIEPKVFDLLAYLLEHADRMVSKDELLSVVWQGDTVTDGALAQCVCLARKVIGDTGTQQRMIATINKRGYRFVASVERL